MAVKRLETILVMLPVAVIAGFVGLSAIIAAREDHAKIAAREQREVEARALGFVSRADLEEARAERVTDAVHWHADGPKCAPQLLQSRPNAAPRLKQR